jgi:hypothetical protein
LRKLSIANTGRVISEETRRKLSIANKGKILSEETRMKMSASRKGIVFSEERKESIRKSKLGKSTSLKGKTYEEICGESYLERIEKLRMYNTGKVMSEETKQKISNSKKGTVSWNKGISVPSKYVYTIKSPDGEIVLTRSISNLCKENDLNKTCMLRLATGKQKQHKGWTFIKREKIFEDSKTYDSFVGGKL